MNKDKLDEIDNVFQEIMDYQMQYVQLAKTTDIYKLAEKGKALLADKSLLSSLDWINVDVRMPPVNKDYVLFVNKDEVDGKLEVRLGNKHVGISNWYSVDAYEDEIFTVTHWMPLPKLPITPAQAIEEQILSIITKSDNQCVDHAGDTDTCNDENCRDTCFFKRQAAKDIFELTNKK